MKRTLFATTFFLLACVLLAGCAKPPLTREEYLALNTANDKAMSRQFPGKSKEQLIAACEQALTASDSKYEVVRHMENGFYAKRNWFIYVVFAANSGESHWKITVEEKDGVNTVFARSWNGGGVSISPIPISNSGASENDYYVSPPLYKLFFDRVEYFLGLRHDWASCDSAESSITEHERRNNKGIGLHALCTIVRERDPTKPAREKDND